jgi:high-affinity Fe2+/Pb2+ permease
MSNRITPVFFAIVFMGAIATTSVFGGFALLLFLLVLSAVMIGERAFALRQR